MGCFFKLRDLTCLNNSRFFFFSETLLIFGGKRCRLLSPFRRETRLGVDRYLRTVCWPLFGIPPLWFRVGSPKTLSCLDRVRATITFQCPRILSTQEIQLLPTGSINFCDLWNPGSQRKQWSGAATNYTSVVLETLNSQTRILLNYSWNSDSQWWWEGVGVRGTSRRFPDPSHHLIYYSPLHILTLLWWKPLSRINKRMVNL